MIKNNPHNLLKKAGITFDMLDAASKEALSYFDDTMKDLEEDPEEKELIRSTEQLGLEVSKIIEDNILRIKGEAVQDEQEQEKKKVKKHQSKKTIEKAARTLDDLSLCRERLKEERQRKIASGEISKPKRKTLATKLRVELLKTVNLIPKNLKGNTDVLTQTKRAILKFLNELKGIWGLSRIKPIEDDLKERFKKLEDEADRLAANN
jgi:hypothetical protein